MLGNPTFYAIKIVRLLLIYAASGLAVRIQEAKYVEEVYGRGHKPPSLTGFLLTLVAFMLLFDSLLLAAVRGMAGLGFKRFARRRFVTYLQTESLVYTLFVLGAGFFLTRVVAHKKYINYREDGMRALRSLRELLMAVVVPVSVTPVYFLT